MQFHDFSDDFFPFCLGTTERVMQKESSVERLAYSLFSRHQSHWLRGNEKKEKKKEVRNMSDDSQHEIGKESSDDEEPSNHKLS